MAKLICIGSGSSGNCYILQCKNESIIIELGVAWKKVLETLNYNIEGVLAALCSHV